VRAAEAFGDLKLTDGNIMTETIIEKEKEKANTVARSRREGAHVTLRGGSRRISIQLLNGAMSMAVLTSQLDMLEARWPAYLPEPLPF
jgi:hypothetical protein